MYFCKLSPMHMHMSKWLLKINSRFTPQKHILVKVVAHAHILMELVTKYLSDFNSLSLWKISCHHLHHQVPLIVV